jgi:molybdopterin-guanine dinucleotide biosynthesis protein A
MGRDKALLPWKESTFLETIAARLDFLHEKYLSVAAADTESDQGGRFTTAKSSKKEADLNPDSLSGDWIRLPDLIPDCGPLGGIYTALNTCKAQWALVVSCDIPAVEQRLFTMLLEECCDDVDIIYPLTPDGRMHMTCALYRKEIAPILRHQIETGDNRLRVLADLCRAKAIRIEQPELIRMVSNINTGEEFDRFLIG